MQSVQMTKIQIQASVTYSCYKRQTKYHWRDGKNTSDYKKLEKRAVLRIATGQFGRKASGLAAKRRQIDVSFHQKGGGWVLGLKRIEGRGVTLSTHTRDSKHIWLQAILNRLAPRRLINELKPKDKFGSRTLQVKVGIDLDEWRDIHLRPEDFLYHTETHAKSLISHALTQRFSVEYVPKGREYDLQLISPRNKKLAIAISSYNAKTESRSKQQRVQKALIDIAKMLPSLHNDKSLVPVIVSQPFHFDGSCDITTDSYIKFYKDRFNFKFVFTDFAHGWERRVCSRLGDI